MFWTPDLAGLVMCSTTLQQSPRDARQATRVLLGHQSPTAVIHGFLYTLCPAVHVTNGLMKDNSACIFGMLRACVRACVRTCCCMLCVACVYSCRVNTIHVEPGVVTYGGQKTTSCFCRFRYKCQTSGPKSFQRLPVSVSQTHSMTRTGDAHHHPSFFYIGSGDLNLDPHMCAAVLIRPFLQPPLCHVSSQAPSDLPSTKSLFENGHIIQTLLELVSS